MSAVPPRHSYLVPLLPFGSDDRDPHWFSTLRCVAQGDSFRGTIIAIVGGHGKSIISIFFPFLRAAMDETVHFLAQHGTVVLFAAVLAEQIGLPLPAVPFLIAAGALAGTGQMTLGMAVGSAVLAARMGDQVCFKIARSRG